MAGQAPTMLIYPEDKKLIYNSTLNHKNRETGGDLFGLWQSESEIVVQVVSGPGINCRRTHTSFFQDEEYLTNVGGYLTLSKGLCNIGEWHSHHSLNLPEPSSGDRETVWRNMPGYGLKRFLLIIATITPTGQVEINGFMFTAPRNERLPGKMDHVRTRVLTGPNPYRRQPDVIATLREGAEAVSDVHVPTPRPSENDESSNVPRNSSPKKGKKMRIKSKKKQKKEKPEKKAKDESKKGKKRFGLFRKRGYSNLPDEGGKSGTFSQSNIEKDSNAGPVPQPQDSDNDENYNRDQNQSFTSSQQPLTQRPEMGHRKMPYQMMSMC